jgi:hypothetical protein
MAVPKKNSTKYELETSYTSITNEIERLQEIEKHIRNNLNDTTKESVDNRIKELVKERNDIFNKLENIYDNNKDDLTRNRKVLKDQVAMVGILDNELTRTKKNLDIIKSDKQNKLRLVEIGNYESQRYLAYIKIMKTIVYASILLILVFFINKRFSAIIPSKIIYLLVVLIIGTTMILVSKGIYDIMRRNDLNFEKYDYNKSYDPNMTAENSTSYLNNKKYSSGDDREWLSKSVIDTSDVVEGMMNYQTNPQLAQEGTIVSGVASSKNATIETFSEYN